ncbi:hypothetical protein EYF80_045728 [Liparis tanakae]|uniref:Uncharacterized protein n=1 Tax=Liparis tanakae TaxID=230148 RepID=A0A4Z2FSU5_9TELE|nr:hypothetical protein EYF80_045728 [Liparis tanakae]
MGAAVAERNPEPLGAAQCDVDAKLPRRTQHAEGQQRPHPSLVGPVHEGREVFHPAVGVWVLEEHPAHIFPGEVHLMRKLQHRLHPDVAATRRLLDFYRAE